MSVLDYFVGFWKVLNWAPVAVTIDLKSIQGTVFELSKTGDVTWKIPENAMPTSLFKCDTYEIVLKKPYLSNCVLRFGSYKGHIIDCTVKIYGPFIGIISINDGWSLLVCKKFKEINQEDPLEVPFSFLPALQDSYFSDLTIKASNNKEFKVHTCILKFSTPEIDWFSKPAPLSDLSEDVTFAILHFLYGHCLPAGLKETTIKNIIFVASQMPGLEILVSLCHLYIRNLALKNKIFSLVSDIHMCASQIIEYFMNKPFREPLSSLVLDPAKLCSAVKNSIREAAVAASKLILICNLYNEQKHELSKEEGHEIILHAKSRIPIFMKQFESFLQIVKTTFSNLLPSQRQELACYLVPEVETICDTVVSFLIKVKNILEVLLEEYEVKDEINSHKNLENLEQYSECVLLRKEIRRLKDIIHRITSTLMHLHQKKENFKLMTSGNKIRSVAKNLEHIMEELPILVLRAEEFTSILDEKLQWNEYQFCFRVGTSKVSEIIKKLISHKGALQDLLTDMCDLVQRDSFSQSLVALGLLEHSVNTSVNCSELVQREKFEEVALKHGSSMDSICVPPPAYRNRLSEAASELLKSGQETDMTFEIVTSGISDSSFDNCELVHVEELPTAPTSQPEVCRMAAHRVIVASRCDWFRRALLSGMQEDIHRKIQVHNTSPFLFSLFLKYLYSGQLNCFSLSVDHISELLLLSDRYELDSLKQVCEYGLKPHLDIDSVLYFYNMSDRFNAKILKSACEQFMVKHPEVIDSEVFKELPDNLQSEVYNAVICRKPPTLDVSLEKIFTSISYSADDIGEMITNVHLSSNLPTPNSDDMPLIPDFPRLEAALEQLQEILGQRISRSQLVQIILAADYDMNRAINFYYSSL